MTNPGPWTPDQYQAATTGPYLGGPPSQVPVKKKGGCMKWGLIGLGVLVVLAIFGAIFGESEDGATVVEESVSSIVPVPSPADAAPSVPSSAPAFEAQPSSAVQPAPAPEVQPVPAPEARPEAAASAVPGEYKNALRSAQQYLNYTAFSQQGLTDQLLFENYSLEAAQYAAVNVGADWNDQAAKSAQQYMDYTSFSRQGLVDQLVFEGFTPAQAEFGVSQVY